jgi:hypothetical protein
MKYLENYKSFESVDSLKTKLTKDFIFNIEDIFLDAFGEDIAFEKSYFDIESESWNKVSSLYDVPDDAFSICVYFSLYLRNEYKPINSNILSEIIESIKRSVIYYNSLSMNDVVDYNIQYRAIGRAHATPTKDTDINLDNIDNLLKGDIYSIDITFFTI